MQGPPYYTPQPVIQQPAIIFRDRPVALEDGVSPLTVHVIIIIIIILACYVGVSKISLE